MKFLIVHEAQVVLVHIVLHAEENEGEDSNIRDNYREN